jgi:hypothetical protein
MGYFSAGYYTICLSPIVSIILSQVVRSLFYGTEFTKYLQGSLIVYAIPTLAIQAFGIALCLVGLALHESMHMGLVHEIANIILLLWGMLATFSGWWAYGIASTHPQYISQHAEMEFETISMLIGLLWFASGLFFIYLVWRNSKIASRRAREVLT